MNIIVFSKNRAAQLELFIRSFKTYVKDPEKYELRVIYLPTEPQYDDGYKKLIEMGYKNIVYVKETVFYQDIVNFIDSNDKHLVFFSDDNIFKNHIDFDDDYIKQFDVDKEIACISLRLHPKLTFCYPMNIPMTPPQFMIDNTFYWKGLPGDYGYPMSVDGHIFRTDELLPTLQRGRFPNPTMLENFLVGNTLHSPKMLCYDKSIIVNNPCNRASTCAGNIHGKVDLQELNRKFLNGQLISLDNIDGIENISCHQEIEIKY